jgi:hypothetical protein
MGDGLDDDCDNAIDNVDDDDGSTTSDDLDNDVDGAMGD